MQWVQKAVQYYKDINPATLTGAIDVIVVERPSESTPGDVELACSPFHVRFGKLSVLRPIDKKVRITINDEQIPYYMKVGETGEAFFVFETDADVPEDLQTSPITSPVADAVGDDGAPGEPDFLDLDGGEARDDDDDLSDSPSSSRYASFNQTQLNSPTTTIRRLPGIDEFAQGSVMASPSTSPSTSRVKRPSHTKSPSQDDAQSSTTSATTVDLPSTPPSESDIEKDTTDTEADSDPADKERERDGAKAESRAKAAKFVPASLMLGAEKAASLLTSVSGRVGNDALKDIVKKEQQGSKVSGEENRKVDESVGVKGSEFSSVNELEKSMQDDLKGVNVPPISDSSESPKPSSSSDNPPPLTTNPGDDVRQAARDQMKDVRSILGGPNGIGRPQSIDGGAASPPGIEGTESFSLNRFGTGPHSVGFEKEGGGGKGIGSPEAGNGGGPEMSGDLMLDMAGYKLEEEDGEKAVKVDERVLTAGEGGPLGSLPEEEMLAFTQSLLQSTDPKTLRGFFDPSAGDDESSRAASPTPLSTSTSTDPDDKDDAATLASVASSVKSTTTTGSVRATSPHRQMSISSLQNLAESVSSAETDSTSINDGVFQASPKQFSLRVGGRVHIFELSLCGSPDFGHDRTSDERAFAEHQVTFSQFMEHDSITDHADLVVKYSDRYLTWDNASPVLASLAVYRQSLVDHPEHHRHPDQNGAEIGGVEGKRQSRGWGSWFRSKGGQESTVSLPTAETTPPVSPPISRPASPRSLPLPDDLDTLGGSASPPLLPVDAEVDTRHYAKTLRLTSDQLKTLGLKKGMNVISFSVRSSYSGFATCTSRIFLWESDFQVVISDIDGTITKSDALGHVFTMIGRDWTHLGVAKLYTDIARNGYKMMYLTSRAIGQADTTREYLKNIQQNGFKLPEGPVIMSPDRLMTSLHREVVLRKPEVFKMACLRDIKRLFHERPPFYAGFGNRITDALSYRSVDVPSSRIFTIDSNGEVKMELLELAGYKSSYIHMSDLVDQMFPPINRRTAPEFTDFNYWRAPMAQFDLPDLSPPSPALSARSDSSRIAFPRLGSIASSLSRRSSRTMLNESAAGAGVGGVNGKGGEGGGGRGRERAASPSSPLLQATVMEEPGDMDEEEYDDEDEEDETTSMPGSLPNESDFERLRRAEKKKKGKSGNGEREKKRSEAEKYKEQVIAGDGEEGEAGDGEEEDQEEEEEEGQDDDFGEELDFSSVPYL